MMRCGPKIRESGVVRNIMVDSGRSVRERRQAMNPFAIVQNQ